MKSATPILIDSGAPGDLPALEASLAGEGLSPAMYGDVLRRGVRADESGEGSGLGLSIAKDLAECAGGTLALEPSPLGGLRVTVTLPASAAGARPSGED